MADRGIHRIGYRPRFYAKKRHRRRGRGRRRGANQGPCRVVEKKFHDVTYSADSITTATATLSHTGGQSLVLIPQGLTEQLRIGRRICIRNILVKGHLALATGETAATGQNLVRLFLVLDHQANGADATATDVWETATAGIHSYRNLANQGRFDILWSKLFTFNTSLSGNGTALDTAEGVLPFSFSKKVEFIVQYNAGAGAITEIESNNIFLMGVTFNSNVTEITARGRIRFTD